MNDLHQLHNKASESLVRRLFDALYPVRGGVSDIGQAEQSDAGSAPICTDAPGMADAPGNSGGDQSEGVKA